MQSLEVRGSRDRASVQRALLARSRAMCGSEETPALRRRERPARCGRERRLGWNRRLHALEPAGAGALAQNSELTRSLNTVLPRSFLARSLVVVNGRAATTTVRCSSTQAQPGPRSLPSQRADKICELDVPGLFHSPPPLPSLALLLRLLARQIYSLTGVVDGAPLPLRPRIPPSASGSADL